MIGTTKLEDRAPRPHSKQSGNGLAPEVALPISRPSSHKPVVAPVGVKRHPEGGFRGPTGGPAFVVAEASRDRRQQVSPCAGQRGAVGARVGGRHRPLRFRKHVSGARARSAMQPAHCGTLIVRSDMLVAEGRQGSGTVLGPTAGWTIIRLGAASVEFGCHPPTPRSGSLSSFVGQ
jgi:hypothetical protein